MRNLIPEILKKLISEKLQKGEIVNVIISGSSCSGKTTLADALKTFYSSEYTVAIMHQDDYFKNLCDIPRRRNGFQTDSILAFHTSEFVRDVGKLFQDGVVNVPIYDIPTNTRTTRKKLVRVGQLNIFEGLHASTLLRNYIPAINVYLDISNEICLQRRIDRDTTKYGISEEDVFWHWNEHIKPMNEVYVFGQKKFADIVIQ